MEGLGAAVVFVPEECCFGCETSFAAVLWADTEPLRGTLQPNRTLTFRMCTIGFNDRPLRRCHMKILIAVIAECFKDICDII